MEQGVVMPGVSDEPFSPLAEASSDRDCLQMPHRDLDLPYSILVADAAAARRSAIAAIFGAGNHQVVIAANGKDAFNKANAQNFDLVVTGIAMSELDGLELLAALRKVKPRQPVIVVAEGAGQIDATYLRYAALLGAAGTFHHPLDPQGFLNEAEAIIRQARPDAAGRPDVTGRKASKP
jgi:two-component system chemotaxis response regulator CheY